MKKDAAIFRLSESCGELLRALIPSGLPLTLAKKEATVKRAIDKRVSIERIIEIFEAYFRNPNWPRNVMDCLDHESRRFLPDDFCSSFEGNWKAELTAAWHRSLNSQLAVRPELTDLFPKDLSQFNSSRIRGLAVIYENFLGAGAPPNSVTIEVFVFFCDLFSNELRRSAGGVFAYGALATDATLLPRELAKRPISDDDSLQHERVWITYDDYVAREYEDAGIPDSAFKQVKAKGFSGSSRPTILSSGLIGFRWQLRVWQLRVRIMSSIAGVFIIIGLLLMPMRSFPERAAQANLNGNVSWSAEYDHVFSAENVLPLALHIFTPHVECFEDQAFRNRVRSTAEDTELSKEQIERYGKIGIPIASPPYSHEQYRPIRRRQFWHASDDRQHAAKLLATIQLHRQSIDHLVRAYEHLGEYVRNSSDPTSIDMAQWMQFWITNELFSIYETSSQERRALCWLDRVVSAETEVIREEETGASDNKSWVLRLKNYELARIHYRRARLLKEMKSVDSSIQDYRIAVAIEPNNIDFVNDYCDKLVRLSWRVESASERIDLLNEAGRVLSAAYPKGKDVDYFLVTCGEFQSAIGNRQSGIWHIEKAIKIAENDDLRQLYREKLKSLPQAASIDVKGLTEVIDVMNQGE